MKKFCRVLLIAAVFLLFGNCRKQESPTPSSPADAVPPSAGTENAETVPAENTEPGSAGAETEEEGNPEYDPVSAPPVILDCRSGKDAITGDFYYLLCGKTESSGTVTVSGTTIETFSQYTGRTRFFIPVYAPPNTATTLSVSFLTDGKTEPSEEVTWEIKKSRTVNITGFSIGSGNNFVHWPDWADYACNNYPSETNLNTVYQMLCTRFERIRQAAGNDTQFIILLAPDPLVMYDESASDSLKAMRAEAMAAYSARSRKYDLDPEAPIYTAMNRIADYVNEQNPPFTLIDMTPILKELKQEETFPRLYHTTDNHWSTLGAYYGYRELMNVIYAQTGNEGTKPLELDDFDMVDYELSFANMAGYADPWSAGIAEVVDLLVPKKERTARITSGTILNDGRFWSDVQHPMTFEHGGDLPKAVFLRDSFATSMYPMLNEHFSWTYYSETWDFSINYDWLKQVDPDYVIIIAVERLCLSALQQR